MGMCQTGCNKHLRRVKPLATIKVDPAIAMSPRSISIVVKSKLPSVEAPTQLAKIAPAEPLTKLAQQTASAEPPEKLAQPVLAPLVLSSNHCSSPTATTTTTSTMVSGQNVNPVSPTNSTFAASISNSPSPTSAQLACQTSSQLALQRLLSFQYHRQPVPRPPPTPSSKCKGLMEAAMTSAMEYASNQGNLAEYSAFSRIPFASLSQLR